MKTSALSVAATALLALGVATGCRTFLPFTQEIRDQNRISDVELRNLQYYVSRTITLRRAVDSAGSQVTGNHRLFVVAGKTIEEVVVESMTPGVCVGVAPHSLTVSFAQGTSIEFAPMSANTTTTDPFYVPAPALFAGNRARSLDPRSRDVFWGGYLVSLSPKSTVKFLGQEFDAAEETMRATLLFDGESLDQVVKQRKVLPGVRLPTQ